jgi:outer membrane protein assembly factor BamC
METDWAENRAKLGGDFLRNTIGRVLPGIYSTPERDKFRTRFESNANGETEIFISHRGMIEIYKNEAREQTVWQPREADPGLEAEFLSLLMVRLGSDEAEAKKAVASAQPAPEKAVIKNNVVELDETFDRAWRRVGLALDRVGFTVEDRDRSKGLFFVRYADPDAGMNKKPEGFISKLTGMLNTDKTVPAEQYQIQVSDAASATRVTVLSKTGQPDDSTTSRRILSLLQAQLK